MSGHVSELKPPATGSAFFEGVSFNQLKGVNGVCSKAVFERLDCRLHNRSDRWRRLDVSRNTGLRVFPLVL